MTSADSDMISVVLVDDDPLVRMGLRLVLGGAPDVSVVAEGEDGRQAIELAAAHRPAVMMIDIRMPRMDGITATRQIVDRLGAQVRVLVLTTFDTDDLIVQAVRHGAAGFLVKDTPPEQLIGAVRSVARGEPALSPSVIEVLMARVGAQPDDDRATRAEASLTTLNEREKEVAVAIGHGLSNAEIAKSLFMSVPTVKAHVSRVLTKLEVTNRVQVAILVHDAGLV